MLDLGNIGGAFKSDLFQEADYTAKIYFVNNVLSDMDSIFTSRQLTELNLVLQKVIGEYSISSDGKLHENIPYAELNNKLLTQFLDDKKLYGLSENTLDYYSSELTQFFDWNNKRVDSITTDDFRDYFENVLGWDKGRISSLSLCTAWYDDDIDDYRWYQDITPYTLLNFSLQWLVDDTIALDIEYQIYY
jgi:hypothetical protein